MAGRRRWCWPLPRPAVAQRWPARRWPRSPRPSNLAPFHGGERSRWSGDAQRLIRAPRAAHVPSRFAAFPPGATSLVRVPHAAKATRFIDMAESIFEGRTLDDAVRKGLEALGLSRAEVM